MPAKLLRLNGTAQQGQPKVSIKLTVKEEALLAIGFGKANYRLGQRSLIVKEAQRKRRELRAPALIAAAEDKFASVLARCRKAVVEKTQHGQVMVWDIGSQNVNQCSHTLLRQSRNTPQQVAK